MQYQPKKTPIPESSYCSIEHNRRILRYLTINEEEEFLEPQLTVWNELSRMSEPHCASRAYGFDCPKCGNRVQLPRLCGNRYQCPICARIYCSNEGRKIFTRIMSFNPRAVRFITLTTHPDDILELFGEDYDLDHVENALHRIARKCLKRFFGDGIGALAVVHNWSTQDPFGRPHFHIHIVMPCLRHDNNHWIHLPKFIHEKRLDELKRAWGQYFNRSWLDVHVEYATAENHGKIRHWINYSIRRPVLDVNEFGLKENLTFEDMNEDQLKRFWSHILPRPRFRRVRTFGFLAGGHIKRHLETRGVTLQYAQEWSDRLQEEEARIYCPHCHTDLTFMRKAYGHMTYEKTNIEFVVHRKRVWNKFRSVAT